MVADDRTAENILTHLKGQNPKKDVRHERRALTLEEISTLLTVTLTGQKHHNLTGRERYMLYLLVLTTGFRAKELASLTWRRLNLSESEPSITVIVVYARNDKEVTLPLRNDVAEQFRQ
jgi:integrase